MENEELKLSDYERNLILNIRESNVDKFNKRNAILKLANDYIMILYKNHNDRCFETFMKCIDESILSRFYLDNDLNDSNKSVHNIMLILVDVIDDLIREYINKDDDTSE